jgi:hypothetical protein
MSITIDHARDHALTVQGNQAARAWALAHLLERTDLPTISGWIIDATNEDLAGFIYPEPGESPAAQRQKLNAWALALNTDVTEDTYSGGTTLRAVGRCEYGVLVRISTRLEMPLQEVDAA